MKEQVIKILTEKYQGSIEIARIIEDKEYISIHFKNQNNVVIEIYKIENNEIKECISNSQVMPNKPNPSGHTMLDGITEITDFDKTEMNKKIVIRLEDAMMNGKSSEMPLFFDGDNYINHNPKAYDGLTGFAKGMEARKKSGIVTKYNRVILVFAQGNFVQSVVEGSMNDTPMLFCDIFRVENGKIAEHWDVVAENK